jgi:hypothetical protein
MSDDDMPDFTSMVEFAQALEDARILAMHETRMALEDLIADGLVEEVVAIGDDGLYRLTEKGRNVTRSLIERLGLDPDD